MREAGVTLVTVGVFSWALLEPARGRFDFDWLDEVIDLLHAGGIAVDLATATASPPPWLSRPAPRGRCPVDRDGHRAVAGRPAGLVPQLAGLPRARPRPGTRSWPSGTPTTRRWRCGTSPTSWAATTAAATATCRAAAFRDWLRERYGDLDALNEAWGTAFWSQRYGDWEQVLPPRRTHRPSPTRRSSWTSRGSPPTRCSTAPRRARRAAPAQPGRPGHHQLHGHEARARHGLLALGAASWTSSPTTTTSRPRDPDGHVELSCSRRPHPRHSPAAGRGS